MKTHAIADSSGGTQTNLPIARVKTLIVRVLKSLSPRLHYWVMSFYHPIKAHFFRRRHPKLVATGPRILLVAGEDGPDKLDGYATTYPVYEALRRHFNVDLVVCTSFSVRHATRILKLRPDLVRLTSSSGRWQRLLEQHQIPLMGSPSHTCELCYDKVAAKELVRECGIATMQWVVVRKGQSPSETLGDLRFPLVIKPRRGASSYGTSKVATRRGLRSAIRKAHSWDKEAIVEEYAPGMEYTCTVYGNELPRTLPLNRKIMRFEREEMEARGEVVDCARYPILTEEPFVLRILTLSTYLYQRLQCRDMIRIDWKYDPDTQEAWFLEAETLPSMAKTEGNIEECARAIGSCYDEFVLNLFGGALRRCQLGRNGSDQMGSQ